MLRLFTVCCDNSPSSPTGRLKISLEINFALKVGLGAGGAPRDNEKSPKLAAVCDKSIILSTQKQETSICGFCGLQKRTESNRGLGKRVERSICVVVSEILNAIGSPPHEKYADWRFVGENPLSCNENLVCFYLGFFWERERDKDTRTAQSTDINHVLLLLCVFKRKIGRVISSVRSVFCPFFCALSSLFEWRSLKGLQWLSSYIWKFCASFLQEISDSWPHLFYLVVKTLELAPRVQSIHLSCRTLSQVTETATRGLVVA